MRILTVCTANQCRSVLAEAALRHAFAEVGVPVEVSSAGVDADPRFPATVEARAAIAWRGWPVPVEHRARHINEVEPGSIDLVVTAERSHLVSVIETVGVPKYAAFTLIELAQLVASNPPQDGEGSDLYLQRIAAPRPLTAFLGIGTGPNDLADPTGRGKRAHRRTLTEIERHATAIASALPREWPPEVPDRLAPSN